MSVKRIVAACVALVAVLTVLAAIGLDIPKFASQQFVAEHAAKDEKRLEVLAGSVKTNRMLSLENAIAADERRAGDLEIQAYQIEQTGQSARAVRDQITRLRKAVNKREVELNQLRN